MVKVAIAGGSGRMFSILTRQILFIDEIQTCTEVAREVINALVATRKHEIVVFSRSVRINH